MNYREMRRKDRALERAAAEQILKDGEYGVLSVLSEEGTYGVPVNYCYSEGKIYFHCAPQGKKIDAIKQNPQVCFTVVGKTKVLPEEFTSEFESVIAVGKARFLQEEEFKKAAIMFGEKYSGVIADKLPEIIDKYAGRFLMIEIAIDHMTGKANVK